MAALAVTALIAWFGLADDTAGPASGRAPTELSYLGHPPIVQIDRLGIKATDFEVGGRDLFSYFVTQPPIRLDARDRCGIGDLGWAERTELLPAAARGQRGRHIDRRVDHARRPATNVRDRPAQGANHIARRDPLSCPFDGGDDG